MPFCASCGSQVEGNFCPKCGASQGAAAAPPPPPAGNYAPPAANVPPPAYGAPQSAGAPMADNVASGLCYVVGIITGVIFLVLAPYNQNKVVRFHAFQSIFFSLAWFVVVFVLNIVFGILHLWFISFGLMSLIELAGFVLWIYLLITTFQGKTTVLPIIGPLAQNQA
jgi:uncharacterized membrane protein